MAKARFAKGLRKGSTKTETYSTLSTRKEGRIQIIKDRVTDITNPQTDLQMLNRVCFVTASQAAAKMYDIISISQEGESKPEYARQLFISQNTELLKKAAYKRVGLARHYRAAYAPKGNQQLIPNSYQVSKGSLTVPEYLVPKTGEDVGGASFQYNIFDDFGREVIDSGVRRYQLQMPNPLIIGSSYTVSQLWEILFSLLPGDQLTFPQIYGDGVAQALYAGESEDSAIEDKTLITQFCAPRMVLKSEMPTDTITISAETTAAQIKTLLLSGIDNDNSYMAVVNNIISVLDIAETQDTNMYFELGGNYGAYAVNGDSNLRAVGVILSRYDSERKKWLYSTSNLVCVWDFLSQNSGANYFGFTIDNAIATYRAAVTANANGNFLQRGGTPDIVPASFR
ncbi:hypothetical protein [Fibrobacter sp.]|uniref:hypothetical protein n=1 Tax=Fibrobacter sp. TaxID=35828 RepID=UPI0025C1DEE3|nr:hypothetical protein [Fibrobacter sp.]MBR4007503.1 hypothetical protein [Fibrobacter sp.]